MYVKNEPQCHFDIHFAADLETEVFREEIFGRLSSTDTSETNSDDDYNNLFPQSYEMGDADSMAVSSWESSSNSSSAGQNSDIMGELAMGDFPPDLLTGIIQDDVTFDNNRSSPVEAKESNFLSNVFSMKEEPNSPVRVHENYPSPDDSLWRLLNQTEMEPDIKPPFKVPDTPPITPPQNDTMMDYSPPHSPEGGRSFRSLLVSPAPSPPVPTTIINTANNRPMKVVTISTNTAARQNFKKSGRVSKTLKIQPKVITAHQQVISIVNPSIGTKLTLPKINQIKTEPMRSPTIVPTSLAPRPPLQSKIVTLKPSGITTMISSSNLVKNKTSITSSSFIASPHVTTINSQTSQTNGILNTTPKYTPLVTAIKSIKQEPQDAYCLPIQMKAIKRQQRMIKNRESASLSRKKKKEYVTALEGQVNEVSNENTQLKNDNLLLRQRVEALEQECSNLRKFTFNPSKKSGTLLLGMLFMFSLTCIGPIGSVLTTRELSLNPRSSSITSANGDAGVRLGSRSRSLLWLDETSPLVKPINNVSTTCPIYINATESLRLETDLRDWFQNDKSKKPEISKAKPVAMFHPRTSEGRKKASEEYVNDFKYTKGSLLNNFIHPVNDGKKALSRPAQQLPSLPNVLYPKFYPEQMQVQPSLTESKDTSVASIGGRVQSFLEAIQRRGDTYYVVSFSPDHLLIPATTHNATARPRMSLLLPTPRSLNGSVSTPPMHVSMMQIDCEVTDTHLVHVAQDKVPLHLRPVTTNASGSHSNSTHHSTGHRQPKIKKQRSKVLHPSLGFDVVS